MNTTALIREKILDYVALKHPDKAQALQSGKKICCINPDHNESTPSMGLMPNKIRVKCFGCSVCWDIFNIANVFEGLPSFGVDFYTKTIPTLAKQFGIPYESQTVTEEQADIARMKRVCENILELLREEAITTHAESVGIIKQLCRTYGIGSVKNFADFRKTILGMGSCDEEFLDKVIGISDSHFGPDILTYTMFNHSGVPVGFHSRDMNWKKLTEEEKKDGKQEKLKYVSTKSTIIYKKADLLYGYHIAKATKNGRLFIVEGQKDAVVFHQNGLKNTVALTGSELTIANINAIERLNCQEVVLCLDNDKGGHKATLKIVQNHFTNNARFRLAILQLPKEHQDPDTTIRALGSKNFLELPIKSSFDFYVEYKWSSQAPQTEEEKASVAEDLIKIAASEASTIRRSNVAKKIAELSGYKLSTITSAIEAEVGSKTNRFITSVDRVRKDAINRLQKTDPLEVLEVLRATKESADDLYKDFSEHNDEAPIQLFIDTLHGIKNPQDSTYGRYVKTNSVSYDNLFSGIRTGVITSLLANSSSGKSSLLAYLTPLFLEDPDVSVLYHTTDDPVDAVSLRLVSTLSGVEGARILKGQLNKDEEALRDEAVHKVQEWGKNGRLDVRDAASGYSMTYAERWIKGFKDRNPERKILYICDNLYNSFIDNNDVRAKVETAINHLKIRIAQGMDVSVLCTVEPRKAEFNGKPRRLTKSDVKETSKLELASNAIWILHNGAPPGRESELEITGRQSTWVSPDRIELPFVEVEIVKDKFHGSGLWRLKFNHLCCRFEEVSCERGIPKNVKREAQDEI